MGWGGEDKKVQKTSREGKARSERAGGNKKGRARTVVVDIRGRGVRDGSAVRVGAGPGGHRAPVAVASIERQVGVCGRGLVEAVHAAAVKGEPDERGVAGGAAVVGDRGRGSVEASRVLVCQGVGERKQTKGLYLGVNSAGSRKARGRGSPFHHACREGRGKRTHGSGTGSRGRCKCLGPAQNPPLWFRCAEEFEAAKKQGGSERRRFAVNRGRAHCSPQERCHGGIRRVGLRQRTIGPPSRRSRRRPRFPPHNNRWSTPGPCLTRRS